MQEKIIGGYTFKHLPYFQEAFTHRSYTNEKKDVTYDNERLEFLGDSVVNFCVTEYLFNACKDIDEGLLSIKRIKLVRTETLAQVARTLDIYQHLRVSQAQKKRDPSDLLLANIYEAFIGAMYLDSDITTTKEFIIKTLIETNIEILSNIEMKDSKTLLQEELQKNNKELPEYRLLTEEGPPHKKYFVVGVFIDGVLVSRGTGPSKQLAQQDAANKALEEK